jgi:hypothetical protein
MFICAAGFIANGWAIQHKVVSSESLQCTYTEADPNEDSQHVAVPLTFQALIGFAGSGVFVVSFRLM